MKRYKRMLLTMICFLIIAAPVLAQETEEAPRKEAEVAAESKRATTDDLDKLRIKLEQLTSLVEAQQRTLAELQRRISEFEETAKSAAISPAEARLDLREASLRNGAAGNDAQEKPKAADKPAILAGWDKNHAFLRSEDGNFETQLAGYAQLDFRGYQSGNHPPNTFLIRRARLALEGKLAKYFDYRIEGDFADVAGTLLRDLYVNVHRVDELQLRFGQFRVPISQEEIRSDAFQDFVERSMVNNLVPSRSPGVMASGVIDKGVFEYQIGSFNGKGLLALNNSGTPENAIRLRFNPWKHGKNFWSKGFIFGGAFTQGRSAVSTSVRGQTESRSISWFVPDVINGKYIRANGELTWLLGPAVFRAEYDQTNQSRDNLGPGGSHLPGVVAKGYTGQFTYLLTGETKPEAGAVSPERDLFGTEGGRTGLGAWELKFRYTNLQISDGTPKSNRAETFYFGPNWYLNKFVRYMLDLGFERFKDPARSPNPGDRTFFVVLSRVQFAF